jgi:hypothetical protein
MQKGKAGFPREATGLRELSFDFIAVNFGAAATTADLPHSWSYLSTQTNSYSTRPKPTPTRIQRRKHENLTTPLGLRYL